MTVHVSGVPAGCREISIALGWLLIASVLIACGEERPSLESGPMVVTGHQGSTITRPVGTELTDGLQTLTLDGDRPGILRNVELVGGEGGVELLGALVLPPPRKYAATQFLDGWPPEKTKGVDLRTAVPAQGARIGLVSEAQMGLELLLGLHVVKDGYWRRTAIRITYEVSGVTYRVDLPTELALCTSDEYEVDGRCPAE